MSHFRNPQGHRLVYSLAVFGCIFAVAVIGLGAFTRLADAGLGCPDWPGCYGHLLWPIQEHSIEQANQAWPEMPVDHTKTWPEMVHRYFAASLGLIVFSLVILTFRGRRAGAPFKLALFLLAFVILQGLFGKWTVTLRLWPQVVTAHLLGGFTTLCLLWLLALRLSHREFRVTTEARTQVRRLGWLAAIGLLIVTAQVALGGWTTSNYAAVACPDFPRCQGQWLPKMDLERGFDVFQSVGPNYLGGMMDNQARVAIHVVHRVGAMITALYLLFLCGLLLRSGIGWACRLALVIGAALVMQVSLGIGNIVLGFPTAVAVAHNLGGALLLLTLVTLVYCCVAARKSGYPYA